jgi:hypothetical protein
MAFNLSTFRRKVHSIGRNQYFAVRIPQVGDEETITAMARTTTLPAMNHSSLPVWYRGLAMKIDNRPEFTEWNVNFLCDEAHGFRNVFLKWMASAYSVQTLTNVAHNVYKKDGLSVSQLASDGSITSTAIFMGAFPTNVGEINLSQEGGEVETFQVTFTYDYYLMNDKEGDVVSSELDIDVGNDGRYAGVTVNGVAGVSLNI